MSFKDIAETLNIVLPDNVASSLASDVEYRLNQVIEVRLILSHLNLLNANFIRKQRVSCAMVVERS